MGPAMDRWRIVIYVVGAFFAVRWLILLLAAHRRQYLNQLLEKEVKRREFEYEQAKAEDEARRAQFPARDKSGKAA